MKKIFLFARGFFFVILMSLPYISSSQAWRILGTTTNPLNINSGGGFVSFATNDSGKIYVGYTNCSNYSNFKIWDGSSWTATPTFNLYGYIHQVAADNAGNAYMIGNFSDFNGGNVYKWDGNTWSSLGLNSHYPIGGILTDKFGNLYASASYALNINNVFKWDGSTWSQLGTGNNALNVNSTIYAMAVDDSGFLYAGGYFTNANGSAYVAKWDGNTWSEIGAGTAPLSSQPGAEVYAIAVDHSGNIYASGTLHDGLGGYVAKWDGTSWSIVGDLRSLSAIYSLIADTSGNIYAGVGELFTHGLTNIAGVAKWDGSTWSQLGASTSTFLPYYDIICMAKDNNGNIYACGASSQTTSECVMEYGVIPDVSGVSTLVNDNKIRISPNPANNFLNIEARVKIEQIEIINILGQTVLYKACNAERESIDISELRSAIYFVRINNLYTEKVLKE